MQKTAVIQKRWHAFIFTPKVNQIIAAKEEAERDGRGREEGSERGRTGSNYFFILMSLAFREILHRLGLTWNAGFVSKRKVFFRLEMSHNEQEKKSTKCFLDFVDIGAVDAQLKFVDPRIVFGLI